MQPETASWLNESRGSLGAAQSRFNDISSMDVTGAGTLFMSAEYAVKAVIVEHYGCLPPSFETHRIVNLSHRIQDGWEQTFSTYWRFWLLLTLLVGLGLWILGFLLKMLWPASGSSQVSEPSAQLV